MFLRNLRNFSPNACFLGISGKNDFFPAISKRRLQAGQRSDSAQQKTWGNRQERG